MNLGKTLYVTNRTQWRSWLKQNYTKEKEIWLIFYRKSSLKPRIPYNDAVEEALCFGWIDSTVKSMDAERFAQRFTPRRKGSSISEMNKERVRRLIKVKKMTPAGLNAIEGFLEDTKLKISHDILKVLQKDRVVWKNFQQFPESYKRIRIAYLETRRRQSTEMFLKSLKHFLKMTTKNKKFGMVQ